MIRDYLKAVYLAMMVGALEPERFIGSACQFDLPNKAARGIKKAL